MNCPRCKNIRLGVYAGRRDKGGTSYRRYRKCPKCDRRFVSQERYSKKDVEKAHKELDIKEGSYGEGNRAPDSVGVTCSLERQALCGVRASLDSPTKQSSKH